MFRLLGLAVIVAGFTASACATGYGPHPSSTSSRTSDDPSQPARATDPAPPANFSKLLPDGTWQVDLSAADLEKAGAQPGALPAGVYTWAFEGTRARLTVAHEGATDACSAEASPTSGGVSLNYLENLGCGGWEDTIRWAIEGDGLHLTLVASTAPIAQSAPYLQAKPWQPVSPQPIPSWPAWSVRCEPGCQGPIAAETFTSRGFAPGMSIGFPGTDEWFNSRDDAEELEFDLGETALRLWRNPRPVTPTGQPIVGLGSTEDALTEWFVQNPNMDVTSPTEVILGDGVSATTFTMGVAPTNVNVDPDCPAGVRSCLNVLWVTDDHIFAIGFGSAERLYLFTLSEGDLIVACLDAPDQTRLAALEPRLEALLATLSVPGGG